MAGGMDWFRWHHGSVTDPKFQLVARKAKASLPDVLAVWAYVLEAASQSDDRGAYGSLDCEALDLLFGFEDECTARILEAMSARGLLGDGRVCAWNKRQPKRERESDLSTDRVQAFRQRKRQGTPESGDETPREEVKRHETPRGEERRRDKEIPPYPPQAGEVMDVAAKPSKTDNTTGGVQAEGVEGDVAVATPVGAICKAIRAKGVADVNPSNPMLIALVGKGVPATIFEDAADKCMKSSPPKPIGYLLRIVETQLREAQAIDALPAMQAEAWDAGRSSIEAMGTKLGLGRWNEADLSLSRETFPAYTERVRRALEASSTTT